MRKTYSPKAMAESDEKPPVMSEEEAQAAIEKAGSADLTADDDEVESGKRFEVTPEELSLIRGELACEFPDDYNYLSDAYILSVASKPYSKDPNVRRPIEYSLEKLTNIMKWREEVGAMELEDLVKLANGPADSPEALEDPEKLKKAQTMVTALNYNSIYFHGFTKKGNPILWIRLNRKPWYPDVDGDINALILLVDAAIKAMPEGVTDFVVISESSYPPPPNPTYLIKLLTALVKGYPDRVSTLSSAPVSSIIQFVMNLLLPLMPGRLANKINLLQLDEVKEKMGEDILLNGEADIPNFFGGEMDHDKLFPEEYNCPNRGKGTLKFDYYGMIERLNEQRKGYEEWKKAQS